MTFIEKLQKDCCGYSSAKAARMQAKSLQQLATGIYSGPERFVYELLQNAVDAFTDTNEDSLRIKIYSKENYFIFLHNGAAFTERDVDGLCDVGNGNKGSDNKKVGYKGIGFKSVFMPSTKIVYVKSGDFCFMFDHSSCVRLSPFAQWGLGENEIPWQVIPIETSLPLEIDMQGYNVATVIESSIIQSLIEKTKGLFDNLQFLLFLKSSHVDISLFDDSKLILSAEKQTQQSGKIVLKKNGVVESQWLQYSRTIALSDIVKSAIQTEANVPDKLKETDSIELSFSISLDEHDEFIKVKDTVVYTFLPTAYSNLNLPFLVNANFITDAGREKLVLDSEWNKFIFSQIPQCYLEWIATLSPAHNEYTNVLPPLRPSHDKLTEVYTDALQKAIEEVAFIPNVSKTALLKANNAFIDKTNIISVLDASRFVSYLNRTLLKKFTIDSMLADRAVSILSDYGVSVFKKSDIPALFQDQTIWTDIDSKTDFKIVSFMYDYYVNHKEERDEWINILKGIQFLLGENKKLCKVDDIYIPTKYKDENRLSSDVNLIDEDVYSLILGSPDLLAWLKDTLLLKELSNIEFVSYILDHDSYINHDNAIEIGRFLFQVWKKENFIDNDERQAKARLVKFVTQKGTLLPIGNAYLSSLYRPQDDLEKNALELDVFISEDYYQTEDSIDDWKFFLKKCGAQESVGVSERVLIAEPITDTNKGALDEYPFLQEIASAFYSRKHGSTGYWGYKNPILSKRIFIKYFSFVDPLSPNRELDRVVLSMALARPIDFDSIIEQITGRVSYWGTVITDNIKDHAPYSWSCKYHSFLEYAISEKQMFPTTMGTSDRVERVFINSKSIVELAGPYLPVLDVDNTIHDSWRTILPFKERLTLDDYLLILSRVAEDSDSDNRERISMVYECIIDLGIENNTMIRDWGKNHRILSQDGEYHLPNELSYVFVDGLSAKNRVFVGRQVNKSGLMDFLSLLGVQTEVSMHPVFGGDQVYDTTISSRLLSTLPVLAVLAKDTCDVLIYQENKERLQHKIENTYFYQCDSIEVVFESYGESISKSTYAQDGKFYFTGDLRPAKLEPLLTPLCDYLGLRGKEREMFVIMTESDFSNIVEYLEDKGYDVSCIRGDSQLSIVGGTSVSVGGDTNGGLEKISQIADSNEAKSLVLARLADDGFDVSNVNSNWSVINGVEKDGIQYPLVVKSCKNWNHQLFINPAEWAQLFRPNSMLWLHFGNRVVAPIKAYELFSYQDKLTLSFDTVNLMDDERVNKIMDVMRYFNNVHLDLATLSPDTHRGDSLDDYLFNSNNVENSDLGESSID